MSVMFIEKIKTDVGEEIKKRKMLKMSVDITFGWNGEFLSD